MLLSSNGPLKSLQKYSGLGVCCQFVISSCGSKVTQNHTIIRNPDFPSGYGTAGSCNYVIR